MKAIDVSFLIESLQRRAKESPDQGIAFLDREVSRLVEFSEQWLEHDFDLQQGLSMARSYLVLHKPHAALLCLEATMLKLTAKYSRR